MKGLLLKMRCKDGRIFNIRYIQCPLCGTIQQIYAKRIREKGHRKKLWCYVCKQEVNQLDLRNTPEFKPMGDDNFG